MSLESEGQVYLGVTQPRLHVTPGPRFPWESCQAHGAHECLGPAPGSQGRGLARPVPGSVAPQGVRSMLCCVTLSGEVQDLAPTSAGDDLQNNE